MRAFLFATTLTCACCAGAMAQEQKALPMDVDAIQWGPAPPALPKGAEIAVLSGDPGAAETFTLRLKLPAGYKIPPHLHPHSEPVTVISGELFFGSGDKLDEAAAERLGPGGYVELPASVNHYAFAEVDTVIQITTEGPFGITYANPADDPTRSQ